MYRQDFIDDCTTWGELISFAEEIGCTACDDLVSEDLFHEWIEDNLVSWARDEGWRDLMDRLNGFENNSGYEYYHWSDYDGEYRPVDDYDDFDYYKQEVLNYADEYGEWEEEEPEEDEDSWEPEDPEDAEPTPEEDLPIGDMFAAGVSCIRAIDQQSLELARQQEKAYATLVRETFQQYRE